MRVRFLHEVPKIYIDFRFLIQYNYLRIRNRIVQEFVEKICIKIGIKSEQIVKKPIRGLPGITVYALINALISTNTLDDAAVLLGYSNNPVKQAIREVLHPYFFNRSYKFASENGQHLMSWRQQLLNCIGYKYCNNCSNILELSDFWNNKSKDTGKDSYCKYCGLARIKLRKEYIKDRTPPWAELELIQIFYKNCPENFQVDHIIPLQGKLVSGLHVLSNLQYLTIEDNLIKSNTYKVE